MSKINNAKFDWLNSDKFYLSLTEDEMSTFYNMLEAGNTGPGQIGGVPSGKFFGYIKICPYCKLTRVTTCTCCGCGVCETCGFPWRCNSIFYGSVVS